MKKRFLSIVLTLALVLSLMPAMSLTAAGYGDATWTVSEYVFHPASNGANAYLELTGVTSTDWKGSPDSIIVDLGAQFADIESFAEAYNDGSINAISLRYTYEDEPVEIKEFDYFNFSFLDVDGRLIISRVDSWHDDDNYVSGVTLSYSVHIHHLCGDVDCTDSSHEYIEFEPWDGYDSETGTDYLPNQPGNYYLTRDINLSSTWSVPTGGPVNLCLNRHTVTLGGGAYIKVMSGKTLNLYDCPEVDWWGDITEGCITGGSSDQYGAVLVVGQDSTFIMNGGTIKENTTFGVKVAESSTFTMNGGTISNNGKSTSKGGGVNIAEGTFTMNGGTISENTANSGGGVYIEGSAQSPAAFTMNGGVISGNNANDGAGVYINGQVGTSTFNMSGGIIIGNTSSNTGNGGGVYCSYWSNDNARFVVGGTAVVTGNKGGAEYGTNNVYLQSGSKVTLGTGANGVPAPANGMRVCINGAVGDTFVTSGAKATDAKYFSADDEDLGVGYEADGKLKLVTATDNKLWVAGTRVTPGNAENILDDGKVSYDSGTNTLTLNGANISFGAGDDAGYETAQNSGIFYKETDPLYIAVRGKNTFTAETPEKSRTAIYSESTESVTISGSNKTTDQLVFVAETVEHPENTAIVGSGISLDKVSVTVSDYACGIHDWKSLTVTDSVLDITVNGNGLQAYDGPSNSSSITLTDSKVFAYSYDAAAISATENLTITNSTVEAYAHYGNNNYGIVYGHSGNLTLDETSKLVACGSNGIGKSYVSPPVPVEGKERFKVSEDYFGVADQDWDEVNTATKVVYNDGEQSILPLFVAGQPVRKDKVNDILGDGKVSYNMSSKTLTLNGVTMTGFVRGVGWGPNTRYGVYSLMPTLTVHVTGTSQLGATIKNDGNHADDYSLDYGIVAEGDLTFTGFGNLTVNDYRAGIWADGGDITFTSGYTGHVTINDFGGVGASCAINASYGYVYDEVSEDWVHPDQYANVNLLGGTFTLTNKSSNGIYADGTLTIGGNADVTVTGGEHGIYTDEIVLNHTRSLTAGGGDYGISAGKLNITKTGGLLAYGGSAAIELFDTETPPTVAMLGSDELWTAQDPVEPEITVQWKNYDYGSIYWYAQISEDEEDYARTVKLGAILPPAPPSSGGSSIPTITVPVTGDENTVKVQASVSGSAATVKDIKDADLEKVSGGETVEIDLSGLNKTIDTAKIPTATVEKIAEQGGMSVKLSTATVTFDSKATETISEQAKGNTIELVVDDIKTVSLNAVQKEAVQKLDAALIIDAYLVSNGTRLCSESKGGFGGGKATVALPYEIKGNRTAANYSVYYVDDAGELEKLNASYDADAKAFVFDIEHFSNYVVAYDENAMLFVDVAEGSFYYDAVLWAAKNGITTGADATHFNPNGGTTRAHVVTFLWRAAGCPEAEHTAAVFKDVSPDAYYVKAVEWALSKGITKGTSETTFSPNSICTRAQIAAFMARYAGVADADCQTSFTDVSVNAYYASAVAWMLDNGVTEGTTATTYSPDADCSRAQIVTFLYRWMVK